MRRLLILAMIAGLLLTACASAATPSPTAAPATASKPAASPAAAASPGGSPVVGASPGASPVVGASPSPSPAAAGAAGGGASTWTRIRETLGSDLTLLTIGVILSLLVIVAWSLSNRAEATPNEDQVAEMHHFVNDHFAKYVARGLAAEGVGPVAISQDPAWRKVYLQHLRLHNELHPFVPPRYSWWPPIVTFISGGVIGLVAAWFIPNIPMREAWWGPIVVYVVSGAIGIVPLWIIRRGISPKIALRIFEANIDQAVRRELDALRSAGQGANPAVSL